mgnify:CR=1 FL=1
MTSPKLAALCLALYLLPTAGRGDEPGPFRSGLQVGETAGAFYVEDVTGPQAGDELCYASAFAKRAVVNVQTRALTRELGTFLRELDPLVAAAGVENRKSDSKHAFLVLLTDDLEKAEGDLLAFAKEYSLSNIPLTMLDNPAGDPSYKIAPEAEITVMMWSETKVRVNHAFRAGAFDAAARLLVTGAARAHIGAQPPVRKPPVRKPPVPGEADGKDTTAEEAEAKKKSITATVGTLEELQKEVVAVAKEGSVVVVDLWALW